MPAGCIKLSINFFKKTAATVAGDFTKALRVPDPEILQKKFSSGSGKS